MDEVCKKILYHVGIDHANISNSIIERDMLLSNTKYYEVKEKIPELKQPFSSSYLTCLQINADKKQKWPLLNLVRQILNAYSIEMKPIRKSDGYTAAGIKKYKRFFLLQPKEN
jgi:hypothetical protein